jgi:uncharacterized protein YkwD
LIAALENSSLAPSTAAGGALWSAVMALHARQLLGRARRASVVCIVMVLGAVAALPVSASAEPSSVELGRPSPDALSSWTIEGYRTNILNLTNHHRRNAGVPALTRSPSLTTACQRHANDMARMGRLQHTGSDGSNGGTRARAAGFPWSAWGENIAAGYRSSSAVVTAWMNSSGHRANMLSRGFTRAGIGVQSSSRGVMYYCMLFARP